MLLEIVGHEVLQVEEIITPSQTAIVKTHFAFLKRINLNAPATNVTINTPLVITGQWQIFNLEQNAYVDDPDESRNVLLTITGTGQPVEITLTPINGKIEFEFESPVAGTFKIRAEASKCGAGELEVVVYE